MPHSSYLFPRCQILLALICTAPTSFRLLPLLLLPSLLQLINSLLRQLLPINSFKHILLPRPAISDQDKETSNSVASDRTAENDRRQCERPLVVFNAPGDSTKGDLEQRVTVEQDDNRHEKSPREREMRLCFVRLVERVRVGEFLLMVQQASMLSCIQDAVLLRWHLDLLLHGFSPFEWIEFDGPFVQKRLATLDVFDLFGWGQFGWEVIMVL